MTLSIKWWALLSATLFVPHAGSSAMTAFFTSEDRVEDQMLSLIRGSRSSIDVALFEIRSAPLATALASAKQRGVHVRLLLDASHQRDDIGAGEIRFLGGKSFRGRGIMHHKFALFDGRQVVTGSFNWTPGAAHSNYENALLLDDPKTVADFQGEFERLWQKAEPGTTPQSGHIPEPATGPRRSRYHGHQASKLKAMRIRIPRPVIKKRRKTQTGRP